MTVNSTILFDDTSLKSLIIVENLTRANPLTPLIVNRLQNLGANLVSLNLWGNNMGLEGVVTLLPALSSLKLLVALNLRQSELGPLGMEILAPVLSSLTLLEKLDLGQNRIEPTGAMALNSALLFLTLLKELHVDSNGLTAVVPALSSLTSLRVLNLGYNWILSRPRDAEELASILPSLRLLEELNLQANGMTSGGLEVLAPALVSLGLLRKLNLRTNYINAVYPSPYACQYSVSPAGINAFISVLPSLTTLTELDLNGGVMMSCELSEALVPALLSLPSLVSLDLGWHHMDLKIAEALSARTSLTMLNLFPYVKEALSRNKIPQPLSLDKLNRQHPRPALVTNWKDFRVGGGIEEGKVSSTTQRK